MVDNLISILNLFKGMENKKPQIEQQQAIPKEILDQYPYGQFPSRYTKVGQEDIRKQSENRFSYNPELEIKENEHANNNEFNISTILPFIQLLSNKHHQPKDFLKIFSELLFKDNKDMLKLFETLSIKSQELKNDNTFPPTNNINIQSLKKIN